MKLHKLNEESKTGYATWGCMWKQGECKPDSEFKCVNDNGENVPIQSRITAYWPDGSVKWTAHTGDAELIGEGLEVAIGKAELSEGIEIYENDKSISLDCGNVKINISKNGKDLFTEFLYNGRTVMKYAKATLLLEEPCLIDGDEAKKSKNYEGLIEEVSLEEKGSLQCVVKYVGVHVSKKGERKLPFIIRMRVNYNSTKVHFMHTFVYDGDENKDFLKGIGINFDAAMSGPVYNRHIKVMTDYGVFHEGMISLTSWRPRMPIGFQKMQLDGEKIVPDEEQAKAMDEITANIPVWGEYSLCQDADNHYSITKKKSIDNMCYLDCISGSRTKGGFSFGSEGGCVIAAIRDFWQKYPSGMDVKGLDKDTANCNVWFWSPKANPMDFRHYAERGYNRVCYEGYDYKGADPDGIACTNECMLSFREELIPSDETLTAYTDAELNHPMYIGTPEFYHDMRAFGYWSLPSFDTPMEDFLENQLDKIYKFYENEVEQRKWYGMFNYGDFMHTYDFERHKWKYDVGGYAWDNTELVPTLWLWMYFIRTGRNDVFKLAEKLSRHTSEVDVYHIGKYKGLGSRHNVRHWGCPCKEARIAMAHHHRVYYYLTGDRRFEDIFEELKDNELSFLNKDPLGDFFDKEDMVYPTHARSGPDWSSLVSNWMTRWERFNDKKYFDKIMVGINDLKEMPLQLMSGPDFEYDPNTNHFRYIGDRTTGGNHLQICMGAPEIWFEFTLLHKDEKWEEMLAEHGKIYMHGRDWANEHYDNRFGKREFTYPFMATAMGAFGASYYKDGELALLTWKKLLETIIGQDMRSSGFNVVTHENEGNLKSLVEIPWVSTNFVSQFCLNYIVVLDFIKEYLPKDFTEVKKLLGSDDNSAFHTA